MIMQQGELTVSGKDKVSIPLKGFPREVKVHFTDDDCIVPCNPHHVDQLEWEIHTNHHHHGKFSLVISWKVSGVREIKWVVRY